MTKIRLRAAATVLSAVMAASLLSATTANATGSEADDIVQILESVPTEIPVMQDVTTDGATDLVAPGSASSDLAAIEDVLDVSVSALGENPLSLELLAAQDAATVSVSQDGVEVIDNGDNSLTVPLNRADGSLQVVFVIETTDAPTEYAIDVDLPEGAVLTQDEGGALLATGADGQLALGVAPAWAYDAAGTAVPTHYVVQGSEITQVVEHTSGDYQYPIAADPWFGKRLFSPMTVNRNGTFAGKNVYSGRLTTWGVAMGLSPQGLFIMGSAGLAEFTSQWATVRNSVSLQQQYQCHAVWGRAIIGAGFHWDLELSRPTNGNYLNVFAHRCNW
ncbi:DUF2599 domain-containing protein [Agrococcus sp. Ld7]|uniref:DUF2599 domain-containing protein n=1 Tax=Agrococcus sp. Ld7 TaxID=649148 RepID=UPI00386A4498